MKHKINITAATVEEFSQVEEALKQFSEQIKNQIVSAYKDSHFGIRCTLKPDTESGRNSVKLPRTVKQITEFDKEVSIYMDGFLFDIPYTKDNDYFEYTFVD